MVYRPTESSTAAFSSEKTTAIPMDVRKRRLGREGHCPDWPWGGETRLEYDLRVTDHLCESEFICGIIIQVIDDHSEVCYDSCARASVPSIFRSDCSCLSISEAQGRSQITFRLFVNFINCEMR